MENTLEKMSIDTENEQARKQYTSGLQQPTQLKVLTNSSMIVSGTTTETTTTATNINTTITQLQQLLQAQQQNSSTMNPFDFLNHDMPLLQSSDMFLEESSLDQVSTQHSVVMSSTISTSTINQPSTSPLKDTFPIDISAPTNTFLHLENSTPSTNTTIQDTVSTTTNRSRLAFTKPIIPPPGQTTMPIRVSTKSTQSLRHIECYNCKTTKSPLWRRTPGHKETLCNACGLYYRQYKSYRAIEPCHKSPIDYTHNNDNQLTIKTSTLSNTTSSPTDLLSTTTNRHKKKDDDVTTATDTCHGDQEPSVRCVNCLQTRTPLWRKNERGEFLCNACGLYYRLHHRDRPVRLRKKTIQRRRRDYWKNNDGYIGQQHYQHQPLQEMCLGSASMMSTFSLSQPTATFEIPLLSPTPTSMVSSPDSTTMDDIILTVTPTTTNSTFTTLPAMDKSVLDFGEDSWFASVLVQMDRHQLQGFLDILEQRCDQVRTLLSLSDNG